MHLKEMADRGLVARHYPEDTMVPGESKPENQRQKGIADMWKSERDNMLSALHAPGYKPAKYRMIIEKVSGSHKESKYL